MVNMFELYLPVFMILFIGVIFSIVLFKIAEWIGPRKTIDEKYTTYESGMEPIRTARERFSVKYYMVAILFILFDIEVVFLYPWAVSYRELLKSSGMFIFWEMLTFIIILLLGYFYIWRKGAFKWD
jgi:NADH-quinone oxidoreductase subunit A